MKFLYWLIAFFFLLPFVNHAQKISYEKVTVKNAPFKINGFYKGKSIKVSDGDTFIFLSQSNRKFAIRIEGIDAPEKGMPYARKATDYLAAMLKNQSIIIKVISIDQYGRLVARIIVDNKDVSKEMIAAGYAWHFKKYNKENELKNLEIKARAQKRGLWQEQHPLAPWVVRAHRRAGYSDKEFRKLREQNDPRIRKFLKKQCIEFKYSK
ncbi:MAG TPA: thermonuclease family protein [Edaphocola sp.]|nr:thermonuclease family protein [Edaphocola sp.]